MTMSQTLTVILLVFFMAALHFMVQAEGGWGELPELVGRVWPEGENFLQSIFVK